MTEISNGNQIKIAVLSNVNLNFVIRKLRRVFCVFETEGYGNELGTMMDRESAYSRFQPEFTFLLMELSELVRSASSAAEAKEVMKDWFDGLEGAMVPGAVYYLADGYFRNAESDLNAFSLLDQETENVYNGLLKELMARKENVRVFPLARMIRKKGEDQVFQPKLFYMGKIPYANGFQEELAAEISNLVTMERRTPKKVLALDLDNTLWGGLAGERQHSEILLSDDGQGLIYKNVQRLLLRMKESGVLLVIASKNNPEDAWEIFDKWPHAVLRRKDFAAARINWQTKDQSLREMAKELNLGLDSFVFWDDQPAERELIKSMLPEVTVPDFPEKAEDLPGALTRVFDLYFRKGRVTKEDQTKTESYESNRLRQELGDQIRDFDDYLKSLQMTICRRDPVENRERLLQLLNKTNQFNLTTKRYTAMELSSILEDPEKKVYLYQIGDRFGDYGITGACILDLSEKPVITDFVLSCRVMGKRIEEAILKDLEEDVKAMGKTMLQGRYVPTAKNAPVADLYEKYGYAVISSQDGGGRVYELNLEKAPERKCFATWTKEGKE